MCGIIGYIGRRKASEVLLHGLSQVEYRGYDSAGMAVSDGKGIKILKDSGKLREIHAKHDFLKLEGGIGLGHTRWATHGPPCDRNAHPHTDCTGNVAVVHNGIIENHRQLKAELEGRGHKFSSDTDTEIVAHLIEEEMKKGANAADAVKNAVSRLDGAYALGMLIGKESRLFLARRHAPLIIGKGKKDEMFFASDIPALLGYTRDFILLNEGDMAQIDARGAVIWGADGKKVERPPLHVDWTPQMAQKEGHAHYMIKEILEQPNALATAISADVEDGVKLLRNAKKPAIVACGTSYYAALVLQYLLHRQGISAAAYIGSEYAPWHVLGEDVVVAISQSGETADTLSATRLAKKEGAKILAITNVVGSTLSREADATLYIGVGPEVGVVATKTFTGQLCIIYKLAATLAQDKKMLADIERIPEMAKQVLDTTGKEIASLARDLSKSKNFFFIARGVNYACALEAALKLKEITYLHAEAYAAGELKHGPISMMEDGVPVIAIAPSGEFVAKIESNIMEVKARGAQVIVLSDDKEMLNYGKWKIAMPKVPEALCPLYYILPMQLLAYHMTVNAGKDPDQPRNLAKSVTVE